MPTKFCRSFCGTCQQCREATRELDALDAVYDTLSEEDAASLHQRDPEDPRTFALDTKGRP